MLNTVSLPEAPFITKVEPKSGNKLEYEFEGMFAEIFLDLQVLMLIFLKLNYNSLFIFLIIGKDEFYI